MMEVMQPHLIDVVTLKAYNISQKRKALYFAEVVAFFCLLYLWNTVPLLGEVPYLGDIITLAAIYIGARVLLGAVRISLISTYRSRMRLRPDVQDNFVIGIHSLTSVLSFLVLIGGFFFVFEVDVRVFLTSIGVFAFAIVWIGSEYIKNFIDGFLMMFSEDFKIGDYIRIDPTIKGVIVDITFRATKIKTDEGDTLFVPNSKILHSEVINYSKAHIKRVTVPFSMMRNRLQHLATFENMIKRELTKAFPELIKEGAVYLRVRDIDGTEAHLALEVSIATYNFVIEEQLRKWISGYVLAQDETI